MLIKSSELFRMLLALKETIHIRQSIGVLNLLCRTFLEESIDQSLCRLAKGWHHRELSVNTQFERGVVVVSCWKAFTGSLHFQIR